MIEQQVQLGVRSYSILIEPAILDGIAQQLAIFRESRIILVSDDQVAKLYANKLLSVLQTAGFSVQLFTFPAGESAKSTENLCRLWQEIVSSGVDRQSVVVALGGGVTGDLAGLIAATLLRGIRFVQIPTSLLAQVDSSVGGKVGINLPQAKNIIGAFWQPKLVLIDPQVLRTLDRRQLNAGMAEVIKYGVILDRNLFEFIEKHLQQIHALDEDIMSHMIARCCELKAQVVAEDENETSDRRVILNYGHTFGHAIEKVFGYGEYLHGEAIAIGMTMAAELAISEGICEQELLPRQSALFEAFDLPTELDTNVNQQQINSLVENMRLDKKSTGGRFNLILPRHLGEVEFVKDVNESLVRKIVARN